MLLLLLLEVAKAAVGKGDVVAMVDNTMNDKNDA
jgi:hypothetical protein